MAERRETLASYVPHTGWIRPDGSVILTDHMDMDEEYRTIARELRDHSNRGAYHKAWSRGWVRFSNLAVAPDTYYLEGTPVGVERLKSRIIEVTGGKWFGVVKDIFATPRIFPLDDFLAADLDLVLKGGLTVEEKMSKKQFLKGPPRSRRPRRPARYSTR